MLGADVRSEYRGADGEPSDGTPAEEQVLAGRDLPSSQRAKDNGCKCTEVPEYDKPVETSSHLLHHHFTTIRFAAQRAKAHLGRAVLSQAAISTLERC